MGFILCIKKELHTILFSATAPLFLRAQHGHNLMGESPELRVDSAKHIAKSKGVHREMESEGSWMQTSGLTNRNCIRHYMLGKVAEQTKAKTIRGISNICAAPRMQGYHSQVATGKWKLERETVGKDYLKPSAEQKKQYSDSQEESLEPSETQDMLQAQLMI